MSTRSRWNLISGVGYASSVGIHISSLVVLAISKIARTGYKSSTLIVGSLLAIAALYTIGATIQPDLLIRFLTSLDSEPFSALSGYLPTALNLIIVYLLQRYRLLDKRSILYLIAINFIFLIVARYTYNGIRLLQIVFFIEILILITSIRRRLDRAGIWLIAIVMTISLSAKLRNWESEAELGLTPTPFIPYHFIWSDK